MKIYSLNNWFKLYINRSYYFLIILLSLMHVCIIFYTIMENNEKEKESLTYVSSMVGHGINENNRDLIEILFNQTLNDFGAKSISLCLNNQNILFQGQNKNSCQQIQRPFDIKNFFWKDVSLSILGHTDYKIIITLHRFQHLNRILFTSLTSILIFSACFFLLLKIKRKIKSDIIYPLSQENGLNDLTNIEIAEIQNIINTQKKVIFLEKEKAIIKAMENQALQLAHDIRSPLTALEMATRNLNGLPENVRIIVRGATGQIRDIANSLLAKYRQEKAELNNSQISSEEKRPEYEVSNELLSSIVDESVSLKRIQSKNKLNLSIEFNLDVHGYGLFSRVNAIELKRIISNLLNNSIEAIEDTDRPGIINVHLVRDQLLSKHDDANIIIEDNGKGIPADVIERIIKNAASFGKKNGHGIGLSHARKMIDYFNGKITIQSTLGVGSKIIISLPLTDSPSWFIERIDHSSFSRIVIVDDDSSIHQIWKDRFSKIIINKNITIDHFFSPQDFEEWAKSFPQDEMRFRKTLYLFDFEFLGSKQNGLDLIEKYSLQENSILVTSRFNENKILKRCENINLKIIPKYVAIYIPIV